MNKPQEDEVEISIFGPGYGECILIHCGKNEWIIVDSCINPKNRKVAALEYLDKINVGYDSIKLIIATHWHDDHIRGLFQILKNCPDADFVISEAFCKDNFLELASIFQNQNDLGVSEFSKIWAYFLENNKYPIRACSNRSILKKVYKNDNLIYTIDSLSPSDAAIMLSNSEISKLIPRESEPHELPAIKKRIKPLTPNYSSIVLLITINSIQILLGSDMENSDDENIGWLAILNANIDCKAEVYKIPHHGSSTADNTLIWEKLLQKFPTTLTTPFVLGRVILPTMNDLNRIKSKSGNAYLTSPPKKKRAKTEHFIDKIMKDDVKNRKLVNPYFGHIQLRKNNNNLLSWNALLSEDAMKISE